MVLAVPSYRDTNRVEEAILHDRAVRAVPYQLSLPPILEFDTDVVRVTAPCVANRVSHLKVHRFD